MKNGENKKQRVKRVFALIMTLVMILGTVPPVTFALPEGVEVVSGGADLPTNSIAQLVDGQIWTDKTVVRNPDNTFSITLSAAGKDFKLKNPTKKFDIILALDFSSSMDSKNKLTNLKTAAKNITDKLLGTDSNPTGNQVAVIKYNRMAYETILNFNTNPKTVKDYIGQHSSGTGTNIQDAFWKSEKTFLARENPTRIPILILISDGEPTRYHENLDNHTFSNIKSNNQSAAVLWTLKQARQLNNHPSLKELQIYTIGFDISGNALADATLRPTASNTAAYVPIENPFTYGYWDGSYFINNSYQSLYDALDTIAQSFTNSKPMSYNNVDQYTNIVFTDEIGAGFVIDGDLPPGLVKVGNTVTWTIDGDTFTTMPPGSTTAPIITSKTFKVKLADDLATPGTYYTNKSAKAEFKVDRSINKKYENELSDNILVNLPNRGWLTIDTPNKTATLIIEKTVAGPVSTVDRTFTFSIFKDAIGGDPIMAPVSIIVKGAETESKTVTLSIPYADFNKDGEALYYVQENETAPNENWSYATGRQRVVFKRSDLSKTLTFENTYNPRGKLKVYKDWDPVDATKHDISFILQKEVSNNEGGTIWEKVGDQSYSIPLGSTDPVIIGNLDMGVTYRVQEFIPSVFDYEPSVNPSTVTFDGPAEFTEASITITNKYKPPVGKIIINKEWDDGDVEGVYRPDTLRFNVTGPNVNQTIELNEVDHDVDLDTWSYEYLVTTAGTYTFTEIVPLDYNVIPTDKVTQAATIDFKTLEGRSQSLTFTNEFSEPTGELMITKEWENESAHEATFRPQLIQFKLLKNGVEIPNYPLISLPDGDGTPWTKTITGLELDATYSVVEVLGDPEVDYNVDDDDSVTLARFDDAGGPSLRVGGIFVINEFKDPKGIIMVKKTWAEDGILSPAAVRPTEIFVQLYKDSVPYGSPVSLTDANLEHEFTNLPLDGSVYSVSEYAEGANVEKMSMYTSSIHYLGGGASLSGITLNAANRSGEVGLINTYAKGTVSVYKNWIHHENPDITTVGPATVHLYQVKMVPLEPEMTTDAVIEVLELEEDSNLDPILQDSPPIPVTLVPKITLIDTQIISDPLVPAIFYNLEVSDEFNDSIRYYVEEDPIFFYRTEILDDVTLSEENQNGSITVTNEYLNPKGALTVFKEWDNGYNPNQPASVQIMLWQNNVEYLDEPLTLTDTYTFTELPLGYTYTITEVSPDARYSVAYSGDTAYLAAKNFTNGTVPSGTVTIKNTYIPELSEIDFTKVWTGGENTLIKVVLLRNIGESEDEGFRREVDLNSETGWTHTFTGLEIYGPGQLKYEYYVLESGVGLSLFRAINDQTVFLNPETSSDLSIENIYEPNKGTLVIQKLWLGPDEESIEPPVSEVEVRLIVNGIAQEGTLILSDENDWKVTLSELDVNDSYAVEEVTEFEEFDVIYSNQGAITFNAERLRAEITITNTRTEDDIDFVVNKTISNAQGQLAGGSYTFNYTVELVNNGNRTLNALTIEDFMTAPAGATLVYSPSPTGTVEGGVYYDLEGSLAPMSSRLFSYSVTVNLAGTYDNEAVGHAYYVETEYTDNGTARGVVTNPPTPGPDPEPDPDPQGLINVSFVDEQGNSLSPSYQLLGDIGTNYLTVPRTIDGYELIVTPANANGTFTEAPINVVYVYGLPGEEVVPEEETPLGEATEPEVIIDVPEDEVPLADALPDTGQLPSELFYGIGSLISAVGVFMKRRK